MKGRVVHHSQILEVEDARLEPGDIVITPENEPLYVAGWGKAAPWEAVGVRPAAGFGTGRTPEETLKILTRKGVRALLARRT